MNIDQVSTPFSHGHKSYIKLLHSLYSIRLLGGPIIEYKKLICSMQHCRLP